MENEELKAKVLARCMNATKDSNYASSNIQDWDMEHEDGLFKIDAWKGCVSIAVDELTPSDSKVWPLAAKILHIESKAADTKDLMELGKSIAKTQELLMGMNEPRPSNDLLWEAFGKGRFSAQSPIKHATAFYNEWIATIQVEPFEDFDQEDQSPAWCMDCSKMIQFLEDGFAVLGFHPTLGHCVIASNYGFTQVRDGRFSVVSYASEPREFMDSKSAADWCAEEKVWFIPPHGSK